MCQKYANKEASFTPYQDEDVQTRPYGMHTIPESPSRCEGLVSIAPKTRYAHAETPSRQVQNEDRPQSAPPRLRSSDDQGRFCVARGTVWGVCSDHKGSQRRARMMRCPAASDLWQPTRKELTALTLEVHEKITDFVWKSTKITTPPPPEVREKITDFVWKSTKIATPSPPGGP